jgi:hypothetical protein
MMNKKLYFPMIIMLTKMPSFPFQTRCVCMCKVKPGGGGQIPKCEALHFGNPPPLALLIAKHMAKVIMNLDIGLVGARGT